ncbi:MAG: hypothetical protein OHK0023_08180 [Anaerolineae bacterium]
MVGSPPTIFLLLAGVGLVGLLLITVLAPLIVKVSGFLEVFSITSEGIGEFFGAPRVFKIGCPIVLLLALAGCILSAIALFTRFLSGS